MLHSVCSLYECYQRAWWYSKPCCNPTAAWLLTANSVSNPVLMIYGGFKRATDVRVRQVKRTHQSLIALPSQRVLKNCSPEGRLCCCQFITDVNGTIRSRCQCGFVKPHRCDPRQNGRWTHLDFVSFWFTPAAAHKRFFFCLQIK